MATRKGLPETGVIFDDVNDWTSLTRDLAAGSWRASLSRASIATASKTRPILVVDSVIAGVFSGPLASFLPVTRQHDEKKNHGTHI